VVWALQWSLARWRIATLIPLRDEPRELREAQPAAILQDHNGYLWIGTWGSGLFRLKEGRFQRDLLTENSSAIRTMEEDAAGNLWIGTWFNGLFRYNEAGFRAHSLGRETLTECSKRLAQRQERRLLGGHIYRIAALR